MSETPLMAVPRVDVDDEVVRVTEWRFACGARTGHHRHEHDYVVVPMTDGLLRIESATGTTHFELGHQARKVIAIGPQAVHPDDARIGIGCGFEFDGFEQHGHGGQVLEVTFGGWYAARCRESVVRRCAGDGWPISDGTP